MSRWRSEGWKGEGRRENGLRVKGVKQVRWDEMMVSERMSRAHGKGDGKGNGAVERWDREVVTGR
jgi:hypothetical protein